MILIDRYRSSFELNERARKHAIHPRDPERYCD